MFEESDSIKLWDALRPVGVPVLLQNKASNLEMVRSPSNPPILPRILLTFLLEPPIEKPGFNEIALPLNTVPITARIVPKSTPIP